MNNKLFASILSLVPALFAAACAPAEEPEVMPSEAMELKSIACRPLSSVPGMKTSRMDADGGRVHLRVGIAEASGPARGDILYLHGFADRFDNHLPLFESWTAKGYRVVAFDYPSHGETCGHPIDGYGFNDLAAFASAVEVETRQDAKRPLVVAGWSTGGLLAVRALQTSAFERTVSGAVLFAPAVGPRVLVGKAGFVTEDTLTRNPSPPHRGEITPRSPIETPLFAPVLLANAGLAAIAEYPTNIPTLLLLGGKDTDRYVDTAKVASWAEVVESEGAEIYGRSCPGGYHELDNEPGATGESVREASSVFAAWIAEGKKGEPPLAVTRQDAACGAF
jgi:alpha-beta hydrolase superfamily lysophospholipase